MCMCISGPGYKCLFNFVVDLQYSNINTFALKQANKYVSV